MLRDVCGRDGVNGKASATRTYAAHPDDPKRARRNGDGLTPRIKVESSWRRKWSVADEAAALLVKLFSAGRKDIAIDHRKIA
jgi:hypothetical protein